jgi:diamine N-acetyltransferase
MDIDIRGEKIRLTNTIPLELDRIVEFEYLNRQYVNQYDKNRHLELLSDSSFLHLSVRRSDDNSLIGHIILFGINSCNKEIEFRRITINEKGSGYGREALRLLKVICFEKFKCHRLWLDVYDDNVRAYKLYESEGFVLDGILRENVRSEDRYRSQRIYSMLENEYKC